MIVKEKKKPEKLNSCHYYKLKKKPCSLETSSFALDTGDIKSPLGR